MPIVSLPFVCGSLFTYMDGFTGLRVYLGMSTGKDTGPSPAVMPFTMEVKARMFPCSGESAALRRSAERKIKRRGQYQ